ncbi:MAG: PH domain-containing protein [Lachnospiraceae bacterium]|nr:PH domain-containing protein [Lachnospiraceae bacterium]
MTFKGRTGILIWIVAFVLAACEVLFILFKDEFSPVLFWILVIGFGLILIITVMFEIRNKIIVTEDLVKICFGITTTDISVSTITSLKKTISAIASDSASLHRIEIGYANEKGIRQVFCATRKEDEFIKLLTQYNPKIKVL